TVIASAAVAAVAVIATVIMVVTMSGGDDGGGNEADDSKSPGSSQQDQGSGGNRGQQKEKFKGPDKSNRIEATKCTDAPESFSDRSKVSTPDLRQVNLSSVKDCIRKAGWKL